MSRLRGVAGVARRRRVIARQSGKCAECGFAAGLGLEVHHKTPLGSRPRDDRLTRDEDLEGLCRSCHIARHAPPSTAWDRLVGELVEPNR